MDEDINNIILSLKKKYPVLSNNVSIHLLPDKNKCILEYDKNQKIGIEKKTDRVYINSSAAKLFQLCDGMKSIYEIIFTIFGSGEADKVDTLKSVLLFFQDAEKRGHIVIYSKQSNTPHNLRITGSLDVNYPQHVSIELTYNCNLKCPHCYISAGEEQKSGFIPTDKLFSSLESLHNLGVSIVELTGGEPTLHPDFYKIFNFCISKFNIVAILTNGTTITEETAKIFGKYKNQIVMNLSIDGSTPEIHDKLRGCPGSFIKTTNAARLLAAEGIRFRIAMVTYPENRRDIENVLLLARKLGAMTFGWSPAMPFGRGKGIVWDLTEEEMIDQFKYEKSVQDKNMDFIEIIDPIQHKKQLEEKGGNCGAGHSNIVLGPTGIIRPCLLCPEEWLSLGNIFEKSPEEIFSNPMVSALRNIVVPDRESETCKDCCWRVFCHLCWTRGLQKAYGENVECSWFEKSGIKQYLKKNIM